MRFSRCRFFVNFVRNKIIQLLRRILLGRSLLLLLSSKLNKQPAEKRSSICVEYFYLVYLRFERNDMSLRERERRAERDGD